METIHPKYDNTCASCGVDVGPDWDSHLLHANLEHQGLVRRKCYLCIPGVVFDSKQEFNSHRYVITSFLFLLKLADAPGIIC